MQEESANQQIIDAVQQSIIQYLNDLIEADPAVRSFISAGTRVNGATEALAITRQGRDGAEWLTVGGLICSISQHLKGSNRVVSVWDDKGRLVKFDAVPASVFKP
jgi:hypothetical protein